VAEAGEGGKCQRIRLSRATAYATSRIVHFGAIVVGLPWPTVHQLASAVEAWACRRAWAAGATAVGKSGPPRGDLAGPEVGPPGEQAPLSEVTALRAQPDAVSRLPRHGRTGDGANGHISRKCVPSLLRAKAPPHTRDRSA
jgi:hypothetical protein